MPTEHSVLCNKHFEDSCFEECHANYKAMGTKLHLKSNAVPTIFARPPLLKRPLAEGQAGSPKKKRR